MKTGDKAVDLTNGSILKGLLHLAVPIVGSQVLQMLYNMTDMFWLGRLGSDEVAATGAVGLYLWLSVAFLLMGSIGASIGVSQAFGSKDIQKAKSITNAALVICIVFGAAFSAVMLLLRSQLVGLLNFREERVANFAKDYLSIVAVTIPLTYVSATIGAVFTASGNSRTPFVCNAIGTLINVILTPVFIFPLGLGILGAAYATIFAQTVVFVLFLIIYHKGKTRPFEKPEISILPKWENILWILKKTIPIAAESFLFTFLVIFTTRREAFFGAEAVAISRVGSQIESLTWLVGGAFGTALVSFIGQNYGAKRFDRINETFKIASKVMLCYGAFVSLILALLGKYIFWLFLPDPALMNRSILYFFILAICQIPMCMEAVSANSFRGMGNTILPAVVNTTCNILRVPFVYILSMDFFGLGLTGVWIGISAAACIKGIWSYSWYLKRRRRGVA